MTPQDLLQLELAGVRLVTLALGLVVLTLLPALWRAARGPTAADRAVGADHAFFVLVASVALLGLLWDRSLLYDLVLVATLSGFLSALLLGRFLGSRGPANSQDPSGTGAKGAPSARAGDDRERQEQ